MNRITSTVLKPLFLATLAIVGTAAACGAADPGYQFKLTDFPPSPFDPKLSATPWPKPDPLIDSVEQDLERSSGSTNSVELALVAEIKALKSKLAALQSAANESDPMRQVYGRYVEAAHDWVMKNHQREFGLASQYSASNPLPAQQRTLQNVTALIDMALATDLTGNTNFTPLFKAVFELTEIKKPGYMGGNYARNDSLIGFRPPNPPSPATTFETYLAELNQRHGLVLAKLDEIQRQEGIPTDVIMGWMYGDLYRMLDGMAQLYVDLSTPEEAKKLRQEVHQKRVKLRLAQRQ